MTATAHGKLDAYMRGWRHGASGLPEQRAEAIVRALYARGYRAGADARKLAEHVECIRLGIAHKDHKS